MIVPPININSKVPEGVIAGVDLAGKIVLCLEFHPANRYIAGSLADQENVSEWQVNSAAARRYMIARAWKEMNHVCWGSA